MKNHATLGAQTLDAALRQFPGVKFPQMGRDIAAGSTRAKHALPHSR